MIRSILLSWVALGCFVALCFVQKLFYIKALCGIHLGPFSGVAKELALHSDQLVGFRFSTSSRLNAGHSRNPFAVDPATSLEKGSVVVTQNDSVVAICDSSIKTTKDVFTASDCNEDGWLDIHELRGMRLLFDRALIGADMSALTTNKCGQFAFEAYDLFCANLNSSLGWVVPCVRQSEQEETKDYAAHDVTDVSDWLALHNIVAISTTYHVPYLGCFVCQLEWPLLSAALWIWIFKLLHFFCFVFVAATAHSELLMAENSRAVALVAKISRFIGVHNDLKSLRRYWNGYGFWYVLLFFYLVSLEKRIADFTLISIRIIQWYVILLAYAFGEGAFYDFEYMLKCGTVRIPLSQSKHRGYIRCPLCYTLCRSKQSFRFLGEAENAPMCLVCTSEPSIMQLQCGHLCVCRGCHVKGGSLDGRSHQD